jgi:hypothetical protein
MCVIDKMRCDLAGLTAEAFAAMAGKPFSLQKNIFSVALEAVRGRR